MIPARTHDESSNICHDCVDLYSLGNVSCFHNHGEALDSRGAWLVRDYQPWLTSLSALYPKIRRAKLSRHGVVTFLFPRSPAPLGTEEPSLAQECTLLHVRVCQGGAPM